MENVHLQVDRYSKLLVHMTDLSLDPQRDALRDQEGFLASGHNVQ